MRKRLFTLALCMLLLFSMAACSDGGGSENTSKTIAVIAKGESHAFWQSVKSGAEDAAEKYGYTITFRGPASESARDIPSQQEMIQTALSNNVAGMVVATIGEGFTDSLVQAHERKIPVVQFDSGIWEKDIETLNNNNKNPIKSSVATDNRIAAALAAEKFYEALRSDISKSEKYILGVIQHDETQTGIERAGGFIDRFKELAEENDDTEGKVTIYKEVKPGDAENAYKTALEALTDKGVSAIFMSNEGVVKQVYDAASAAGTKYDKIKFCGFDGGTKQIEWMKATKGPKLVGSVVQDSYNIGYRAVEQVIFAIEGEFPEEEVAIEGAWWDSTNVDEMIQKNLVYKG